MDINVLVGETTSTIYQMTLVKSKAEISANTIQNTKTL